MLRSLVAAGFVLGLVASTSHAAPFTGAVAFSLSGLPPLVAAGAGNGVSLPGQVTISTAAWAATGPVAITLAPTAASPLSALSIALTAPGPCNFTAAGGGGGGLGGSCGLGGTATAFVGGNPFLVVPLAALGNSTNFGPFGFNSSIWAQNWTTGVATVTINGVPQTTGTPNAPGVLIQTAGYDARTAGGGGTIKLVAPGGLRSTLGGNLPLFVTMTLNFVPEPGSLLLLGAGVVGLAAMGNRRRRKA